MAVLAACGEPPAPRAVVPPAPRAPLAGAAAPQPSAAPCPERGASLRFVHNRALTAAELLAATCFDRSGPSCDHLAGATAADLLSIAVERVARAYLERGHLEVELSGPHPAPDCGGRVIDVINEGPRYQFGGVHVRELDEQDQPRPRDPSEPPLPPLRAPAPGTPFRFGALSEVALGLQEDLGELGHGDARVTAAPAGDRSTRVVQIVLEVKRGPLLTIASARARFPAARLPEAERVVAPLAGKPFRRSRIEQLRVKLQPLCGGQVLVSRRSNQSATDLLFDCWEERRP